MAVAHYTQRVMDELSRLGSATIYTDEVGHAEDDRHALEIARARLHNGAWRAGVKIQTRTGRDERGSFVHASVVTTTRHEDAELLRSLVAEHRAALLEFVGCPLDEEIQQRYLMAIDRLERS